MGFYIAESDKLLCGSRARLSVTDHDNTLPASSRAIDESLSADSARSKLLPSDPSGSRPCSRENE
jgi:hypothetical protein